jgi:hypothetical protein
VSVLPYACGKTDMLHVLTANMHNMLVSMRIMRISLKFLLQAGCSTNHKLYLCRHHYTHFPFLPQINSSLSLLLAYVGRSKTSNVSVTRILTS